MDGVSILAHTGNRLTLKSFCARASPMLMTKRAAAAPCGVCVCVCVVFVSKEITVVCIQEGRKSAGCVLSGVTL